MLTACSYPTYALCPPIHSLSKDLRHKKSPKDLGAARDTVRRLCHFAVLDVDGLGGVVQEGRLREDDHRPCCCVIIYEYIKKMKIHYRS